MNYRKDIQILRGIAVLLVVFYHLGVTGFNSGFLGVDVFFVISGFLMAILYDENTKLVFYKKRALRLLPAYFVTILLTLFISIFRVIPNEYNQVFNQSLYADFFVSNIGFWMQNSYFSKSEFNPLLHLWSLGVEIQFYLLIPIIFYFIKISKIYFWLLFILSILLCFLIIEISPKTSFFMMPLRLWEFLVGFGVAKYITKNGLRLEKSNPLIGSIFLLFIFAIPMLNVKESLNFITGHPGIYALFITLSTGVILVVGINKTIEKSILGNFLELMGKYSYSIYLVHFPVIVLFLYQPFSGTIIKSDSLSDFFILLILISFLSYFMYCLVENKLRKNRYINIWLILLPVLIVIVAFTGFNLQKKIYSHKEMLVFDAFTDRSTYRCGKLFRILNPLEIICEITNVETKDKKQNILLVGNSHADAIKTTFASVAQKMGSRVFFLVPNDPLTQNDEFNSQRIIDEALNKRINSIVLHYSPNAITVQTIIEFVELANSHNLFVAFIMPVPVWEENIPKVLWRHHKHASTLPVQTLGDYNAQTQKFYTSLLEVNQSTFKIYPVANYFCKELCSFIENNGRPLYFDSAHLTITGSNRLSSLFKSIITDSFH